MKQSPEIEAVVRRFLAARESGSAEKVGNLFSSSEDLRLIGSDAHEWWQGREEVVGLAGLHWQALGISSSTLVRLEAFENGDAGWAALELEQTAQVKDSFVTRMTLVLELESGSWRIVQIHMSSPVPNTEAFEVELTRTLSDLVDSIKVDSAAPGGMKAETKTVVFTDVVNSTVLSEAMGDRAWSDMIGRHLGDLRNIVAESGGATVKTLGDGGMFAFPTASSALTAALRIQDAIQEPTGDPGMQVRIGIHTGDVMNDQGDYLGLTVNKAARVASAAEGGQILVSSSTADMVNDDDFRFGEPRMLHLKGMSGTHTVQPLLPRTDS